MGLFTLRKTKSSAALAPSKALPAPPIPSFLTFTEASALRTLHTPQEQMPPFCKADTHLSNFSFSAEHPTYVIRNTENLSNSWDAWCDCRAWYAVARPLKDRTALLKLGLVGAVVEIAQIGQAPNGVGLGDRVRIVDNEKEINAGGVLMRLVKKEAFWTAVMAKGHCTSPMWGRSKIFYVIIPNHMISHEARPNSPYNWILDPKIRSLAEVDAREL